VTARTLAERLATLRAQRAPPPSPPPVADRAETLARWFDARLTVAPGGTVLLVERRVASPPGVAVSLGRLRRTCYFDTETTGLSTGAGTVIFLAGLGWLGTEQIVVRQYLLPDYPHEAALLRRVAAELAGAERVVTYNGRAFDLPMLASRLTVHGLFEEQAALPDAHDDLLPVARRLWRRRLGGARLSQVESGVLGVRRESDVAGGDVPGRYFDYLRGGSPQLLADVLDHNLQDVVSLALLEAEVLRLRAGAWRDATVLDPHGMAIELLRLGAAAEALELLEAGLEACGDPAEASTLRRLATRLLLAAGESGRAEALWRDGTRRASLEAATAWIEVARIRERHRDDLVGALEAASAASRVLDIAFALGRGGGPQALGAVRLRVESRLRRLRRWVAAADRRAARRRVA
jgi:uncharacterized protein